MWQGSGQKTINLLRFNRGFKVIGRAVKNTVLFYRPLKKMNKDK